MHSLYGVYDDRIKHSFFSHMELIYTGISKLVIYFIKYSPDNVSERLIHYADPNDYNRIFYHQRNDDMKKIIQMLLADGDFLLETCQTDYEEITEYQFFARCISEQTVVEKEKCGLRTKENETRLLKCATGHKPVSQTFKENTRQFRVSFDRNHCTGCPYQD